MPVTMANTSPHGDRDLVDGRAGLPTPISTTSYWHRQPSAKLIGHRTSNELPLSTDVIVIGSGITGAFAAQELVNAGRSVVMLEAREACWGATGRNGGHCQPGVWDSPSDIARFELETFHHLQDFILKHDIPCDWRVVGGIHAIYSPDVLEAAKAQIKRLKQYPDLRDKAILIQDQDELVAKRVPGALAAVYQPLAAQLWPYKLVAWLLERLLSEHDVTTFNLQTNTPVTRIEQCEEDGSLSWLVHTERGQAKAHDVLLAINAYTSYLVPNMTSLITPVRGQVCALEPPPGAIQLLHSYCWMKDADHQYLIQRDPKDLQANNTDRERASKSQVEDKFIIFGGGRPAALKDDEGTSDDSKINIAVTQALQRYLHEALDLYPDIDDLQNPETSPPLRAAYEWTGIMGYSSDGCPWIGRVPDTLLSNEHTVWGQSMNRASSGALWMCGGYTGHGMPVAARCGVAVAQMILGRLDGVQVPRQWMATDERVQAARSAELPQTLHEILQGLPVA
ncbi:FAD dependent oxidoreductase [Xylaria scruposa]|nr:FAD dependent oxidoreductase [Xylaria scruposa]